MASLSPTHFIKRDHAHGELYFNIGGFWKRDAMLSFLKDLTKEGMPFIERKQSFVALGNLADFVPQDRETAAAIRESLLAASQHGLKRFAVVEASMLVRLQYKRIAQDIEVQFFESEHEARDWLHKT